MCEEKLKRFSPDYNGPMLSPASAQHRRRGASSSLGAGARWCETTGSSALRGAGFTLIEIMVVIVILGILAALIVPRIIERPDEARVIAAKNDIAAIMQALKLYRLDNQRYPTTEQGLTALVIRPTAPPTPQNWKPNGYLERLPKDPWGNPYQYINPGLHGEIDVFSFGADGQPGGTGFDADVGSWDL
jgi:general secretion pathway protein G